jgi:hypothetical protein
MALANERVKVTRSTAGCMIVFMIDGCSFLLDEDKVDGDIIYISFTLQNTKIPVNNKRAEHSNISSSHGQFSKCTCSHIINPTILPTFVLVAQKPRAVGFFYLFHLELTITNKGDQIND